MSEPTIFTRDFTAQAQHIDELGHVNNAVWVQWIQEVAVAHWQAAAPEDLVERYIWVVTRHEIDYLRPLTEGETVTARTWVGAAPRGARLDRHMEFVNAGGKPCVRAVTSWAMIDRQSGRPMRIRDDVTRHFLAD